MKKLAIAVLIGATGFASGVSAEQCDLILNSVQADRFVEHGDGSTLRDTFNGLEWQRCLDGQVWDGSTCVGEPVAMTWPAITSELSESDSEWRLPNAKEIQSIIELNCTYVYGRPTITESLFVGFPQPNIDIIDPTTVRIDVWSSTPSPVRPSGIMYADFVTGGIYESERGRQAYSLRVRDMD